MTGVNVADICIISDGKPGHLNQSLGLAQALQSQHSALTLEIRPPLSARQLFSCLSRSAEPGPKLVIGAGHKTHFSLLVLAYHYRARSVVLMKPSLPLSWFDLCLIPEHDRPGPQPNVLTTCGALNRMQPAEKQPGTGIFLIGGPSKHVQWNEEAILQQVSSILAQDGQRSWALTTSRRTPDSTLQKLRQLPGIELFPAEDTGPDWLPAQLAGTEVCWVTEDSVSMIYEALSAGCQVGTLSVPGALEGRIGSGLSGLQAEKRVTPVADYVTDGVMHPATGLAEAARCAGRVIEKGWL